MATEKWLKKTAELVIVGRRKKMTKENMNKLLDGPQSDLRKIFYDEARKVEKDPRIAMILAEEAIANLKGQLEHSFAS